VNRSWPLAVVLGCFFSVLAPSAGAFSILYDSPILIAPRWDAPGGHVSINVGVEQGFAASFNVTDPDEVALLYGALEAAFRAWESPVLSFNIQLESALVVDGTFAGNQIDVLAVTSNHPAVSGGFFASTDSSWDYGPRTLTNGSVEDGYIIERGDLWVNIGLVLVIRRALTQDEQLGAFQRLFMHEIGHLLGVGHPNSNNPFGVETNWDTDLDPFNPMQIDPLDPLGNLQMSPNRDDSTVMSNRPCGDSSLDICDALFRTTLGYDELGARAVLYPNVPEPGSLALWAVAGLAALGRHPRGTRRRGPTA